MDIPTGKKKRQKKAASLRSSLLHKLHKRQVQPQHQIDPKILEIAQKCAADMVQGSTRQFTLEEQRACRIYREHLMHLFSLPGPFSEVQPGGQTGSGLAGQLLSGLSDSSSCSSSFSIPNEEEKHDSTPERSDKTTTSDEECFGDQQRILQSQQR